MADCTCRNAVVNQDGLSLAGSQRQSYAHCYCYSVHETPPCLLNTPRLSAGQQVVTRNVTWGRQLQIRLAHGDHLTTGYLIRILIGVTDKRVPAVLDIVMMALTLFPRLAFFPRLALTTSLPFRLSFILITPTEPGGMLATPAAIFTVPALLLTEPFRRRNLRSTTIVAVFSQSAVKLVGQASLTSHLFPRQGTLFRLTITGVAPVTSQASPTPSPSVSRWSGLAMAGQLSFIFATLSPSKSGRGHPFA